MKQFESSGQIPKLPLDYFHTYQTFEQQVAEINRAIAENHNFARLKTTDLKAIVADLQTFFQTHIRWLDLDALDPALAHQVQSFNVEIDKQLRLLSMDMMFLQAAKQPATTEQRFSQMRDRLTLLLRYCHGLLEDQ